MDIEVRSVEINSSTITPALNVQADITYNRVHDAPFSISGIIITSDGKTCAFMNEYELNGSPAFFVKPPQNNVRIQANQVVQFVLTALLSQQAIDHIESLREQHHEKAVHLRFAFVIKSIESPSTLENMIGVRTGTISSKFDINQGDWERKYAPALGIGKYILLEFQIPEDAKVAQEWIELYNNLSTAVREMERSINHGDWKKALMEARIFFDSLYIHKKNAGYESFKKKMGDLFIKDQYDQEGIDAFFNGIENFFTLYSKFVHTTNKKKEPKPLPIPTKEDAYFAYVIAIGILNIIGKKASKQ